MIHPSHRIEVIRGDITRVKADAIVNAANRALLGGGGVDGAIHRAGGPAVLEECMEWTAKHGGCATGEAAIITAGNLPARFVIHTVGPVWKGGGEQEEQLLANCYRNSLQLAVDHQCTTIAFPGISTGIYRFPKDRAAAICIATVLDFLASTRQLQKVILVCFDEDNEVHLKQALNKQKRK